MRKPASTGRANHDPRALLAYWTLALADALDAGDPIMTDCAGQQLRGLGFEVSRVHRNRRAPGRAIPLRE